MRLTGSGQCSPISRPILGVQILGHMCGGGVTFATSTATLYVDIMGSRLESIESDRASASRVVMQEMPHLWYEHLQSDSEGFRVGETWTETICLFSG